MKRPTVVALTLLFSTAAIAGSWKTMLSPGAMGPGHQELEGNCDACHLSFAGIPNDRCLACHEALSERIRAEKGFHATVADQDCIACHTDHVGPGGDLAKPAAREAFDHALTGFTLEGSHSDVQCATCHEKPVHEMKALCGECHEDAHSSALGPQCQACHQPVAWTAGIRALDEHLLSMEGSHGRQECDDCHTHGANLEGDVPCSNCHEDVHGGTVAPCDQCHQVTGFKPAEFDHGPCTCAFPGKHQTVECLACHEGFQFTDTPTTCAGCHDDERPHDPLGECAACHTAISWADNLFDHNRQSTFAIEGAHQSVSCVQCHDPENAPTPGTKATGKSGTVRSFKGAPTTCTGCHSERGDAAHGDFSDFGGCEACHRVAGFTPSTFDHATTGFPIDGKHGELGCQDCHAEKTRGYPDFRQTSPPE